MPSCEKVSLSRAFGSKYGQLLPSSGGSSSQSGYNAQPWQIISTPIIIARFLIALGQDKSFAKILVRRERAVVRQNIYLGLWRRERLISQKWNKFLLPMVAAVVAGILMVLTV